MVHELGGLNRKVLHMQEVDLISEVVLIMSIIKVQIMS